MAQQQWNVPSIRGRSYRVGLYHGEESGHLVIYINNKISIIDFGVTDSKDYSFFLESELFELKVTRKGAQYDYALAHNEEADTPHNLQRRSQQRYEKSKRWIGGILLVLMLAAVVALWSRVSQAREEAYAGLQAQGGEAAIGRVARDGDGWSIQFVAGEEVVRAAVPAADTVHPLGFSLVPGDELALRYLPKRSELVRIDWEQLPETQLARYRERVQQVHLQLHPELAARQVACQLDIAYRERGLAGWALFLHQDTSYNDSLNRAAYLRLVRDPEVAEELRSCL